MKIQIKNGIFYFSTKKLTTLLLAQSLFCGLLLLSPVTSSAIISERFFKEGGTPVPPPEPASFIILNSKPTSEQKTIVQTFTNNVQPDGQLQMAFNQRNSIPTYIKADSILPKKHIITSRSLNSNMEPAAIFLQMNKSLLQIQNPEKEFKIVGDNTDNIGKRHIRYQQYYNGIPVSGKEISLHINKDKSIYLFNGNNEKTPSLIDTTPKISSENALEIARNDLALGSSGNEKANLIIFTHPDGKVQLAYEINLNPTPSEDWTYTVDAISGQVIEKLDKICRQDGELLDTSGKDSNNVDQTFKAWMQNQVYYSIDPSIPHADPPYAPLQAGKKAGNMYVLSLNNQDPSSKTFDQKKITVPTKQDGSEWDPAAVSIMINTKKSFEYFKNTFNRDSIDGQGLSIFSYIHVKKNFPNAFWSGGVKAIFYGDGDGKYFSNMTGSLDIVAHEMTHGVTQHTAGLVYKFQSGALNEAFSDIFGAMVDRDDWTIGEDITIAEPGYLRNMADPSKGLTSLPTKMSEYKDYPFERDNGGVHTNCGIPNRAAYLIAEGLTDEGLGESIGRKDTEQLFYRALTVYLKKESQFIDGRRMTIQAAEDLFGKESKQVIAVRKAWDVVEVFDNQTLAAKPEPTKPQEAAPAKPKRENPVKKPQLKLEKGGDWQNVF